MPLEDSDSNKWIVSEHWRIKHNILKKYLDAWIRILGGKHPAIWYWDCFAGRGELIDKNGKSCSPGSSILIINLAREFSHRFKKFGCILIEKDKENFNNLVKVLISYLKLEPGIDEDGFSFWKEKNIEIYAKCGSFEEIVPPILKKIDKEEGQTIAPSFFFIDPFGFSGCPFDLIKEILNFRRTEIFFTFMVHDINRFLNKPILDSLLGNEDWRTEVKNNQNREIVLKKLFEDRLRNKANAKYVLAYEIMRDDIRRTIYFLIHSTNHFKGFKVMKDIMYNESTSKGRFSYAGPDEYQLRLNDFIKNEELIKKTLLDLFKGEHAYLDIKKKIYVQTLYVEKNIRPIIIELEKIGIIKIERIPSLTTSGKKRIAIQDNDKIIFPS